MSRYSSQEFAMTKTKSTVKFTLTFLFAVAFFVGPASPISSLVLGQDLPPFQGSPRILGAAWSVAECCGWRAAWTRRGTSTIFDARYSNPNGQTLGGIINAGITGNTVRVERRNYDGGPLECLYNGRVDGNGRIKGN